LWQIAARRFLCDSRSSVDGGRRRGGYLANPVPIPIPIVLLPPSLSGSSRITVIAPASAPPDPQLYVDGVEALRQRGFDVDAPATIIPLGYLAGPDEWRLEQLNGFLRDDAAEVAICARGGYGVLRLLPDVDYAAARARPKLLVGYSDITALQFALLARAGVPSIAGPMVAPDWSRMDPFSEDSFSRLAAGEAPIEVINPDGTPLYCIRDGSTEGLLIGGNLSMIAALLGSPYMPDLGGAILFLEEVGEPPYRVDRLFAQLKIAGVLERIGGLVLGAFTECAPLPDRPSLPLREVIHHYAGMVNGPVVAGLTFGHLRPKVSLPVGVPARLTAEGEIGALTILEGVAA
jgi:muramoyltetrapeptide carboxypeptidase